MMLGCGIGFGFVRGGFELGKVGNSRVFRVWDRSESERVQCRWRFLGSGAREHTSVE